MALLLLGMVLLGVGVLLGLNADDDRRVVARDLGAVPDAPSSDAGAARPLAETIPVLVGLSDPPGPANGAGPGGFDPGFAPPIPTVVRTREPAPVLSDPVAVVVPPRVASAALPAAPGPLPGPPLPGLVSALYPLPRPVPVRVPVLPATLDLPARAISAPVDAVGTDPSGGMVVPEQVRTVGWWAPGVLPGGASGSAVIAGHVDSRTQGVGVLAVLPQLTEGEPVLVRDATGRAATFRVAARREYGKYDLPQALFRRDGSPQLVLVTCGGRFDPVTRSYESNIVVYAVPA